MRATAIGRPKVGLFGACARSYGCEVDDNGIYGDEALDHDTINTDEFDDRAIGVVRQIVAASLVADGAVGPREMAAAIDILHRFGNESYSSEDLDVDLSVLTRDGLFEAVRDVSASMSIESKSALVDAAVAIACANDTVDRWELSVAREVGEAAGFGRDEVEGIIGRETERHRTT